MMWQNNLVIGLLIHICVFQCLLQMVVGHMSLPLLDEFHLQHVKPLLGWVWSQYGRYSGIAVI